MPITMANWVIGLYSANGNSNLKHPIITEGWCCYTAWYFMNDAPAQKTQNFILK